MGKLSIKEIESLLFSGYKSISDEQLQELKQDDRRGVQKLLQKLEREKDKQYEWQQSFIAMSYYEKQLRTENNKLIAGIDEVGRGPLAGPVVAAAVVLKEDFCLLGLNDSKKLSKKKREEFYHYIIENSIDVSIGVVSAAEIDKLNIYEATKKAMHTAVSNLNCLPEHLLIDAMKLSISIPQTSLIKGDQKSISIAASSIVAKVTRDQMMEDLGRRFPQYGFEDHMGYGTSKHLEAIKQHGVLSEHRKTFAPIKEYMTTTEQMNLF